MTGYVDPQALALLDVMGGAMDQLIGADGKIDVDLFRESMIPQRGADTPLGREMEEVRDFEIPTSGGTRPCRAWIPRSEQDQLPVLIYYTGGTVLNTSLDDLPAGALSMFADLASCIVVVINHRKPPENKYPVMFDDAAAIYFWLLENAGDLGGDATRIAVMGESSGGTLAASVCHEAKRLGLPQPVLQGLFEPMVDLQAHTASMYSSYPLINKRFLDLGAALNFGDEWPDEVPRRASPLLAHDVSGLAYAYIVTAELDPLRDEGHAYAMRLRNAGVRVSYLCYDGQVHGFFGQPMLSAEALVANHQFAAVLRMVFNTGPKEGS